MKTKTKISVSVNQQLIMKMKELVNTGRYRNNSHVVEYAVRELLREEQQR